ncbi:MAG TPA: Fic family protein, partial [Sulfurovum sp.]|nr:Fic family protein [Sulfurovum sp.]
MSKNKIWIWQDDSYPKFTYVKNKLNPLLLEVSHQLGILEGAIKHLSVETKHKVFTESILDEIVYNFSIEGEILQRSSVRSSLRKQFDNFDDNLANKHTDNIVSIQQDVNENHEPLTIERLHRWHHALMIDSKYDPSQVSPGEFREYDDMYVTSGEGIRRKVHYQAPPAKTLPTLMKRFLEYCNTSMDNPIIKSAIVHIWFVQIHPYGDGNGRIARNITNHILSKHLGLNTKYFSISHAINDDLKKYGLLSEETNKLSKNPDLDLSTWILWHTSIIDKAIALSTSIIDKTIEKTKFYDKIRDIKINPNQSKAINMLLTSQDKIITNSI